MSSTQTDDRSRASSSRLSPVPLRGLSIERLPTPLTSFVNREREVSAVVALLRQDGVRLVTLTGPAGVGKTRLALRVADEAAVGFPDGVAFVPLAAVTDPGLVPSAIARALGVRAEGPDEVLPRLAVALRGRRLLVVLDNLEQIVAAGPALAALLGACPALTLLATSRARLRVSGEQVYAVPPLVPPDAVPSAAPEEIAAVDAVRLFVDRARAADAGFALTAANAEAVAEVCRRLDGLPLAIELAAARVDVLSPRALLARLASRLPVLTGGPRDAPPRQHTLRDAIAWSHDLLAPDAQRLFARLAIFDGGISLDAVDAVAADAEGRAVPVDAPPATIDLLSSLVEQSLLRPEARDDGEPRFAMLETIREYALDRLERGGQADDARRRHAAFFRSLVAQAEPELNGPRQRAWLARLHAEAANLRAALAWAIETGDAATALALAGGLFMYWLKRGHLAEGRSWVDRALALAGDDPSPARLAALLAAAGMAGPQGDLDGAERLAGQALALARTIGNASGAGRALHHLGTTAFSTGRLREAAALLDQALTLYSDRADAPWRAITLGSRALVARQQGEPAQAGALLQEAISLHTEIGESWGVARSLNDLASFAEADGDPGRAAALYADSLELAQELDDAAIAANALAGLARAMAAVRPRAAAALFGATAALREAVGGPPVHLAEQARSERALDATRRALGDDDFAAEWARGGRSALPDLLSAARAALAPGAPPDAAGRAEAGGSLPDLTRRELEVLRLLVEGRSDRAIGAALSIGHRTVSSHVASILGKLAVDSRTAATAQPIRRGLT